MARHLRDRQLEGKVMPRFQWLWGLVLVPLTVQAAELRLGARAEVTHPGKAQEVHLSGAAVAVGRDGGQTFSPIHVLSQALKAYAPSRHFADRRVRRRVARGAVPSDEDGGSADAPPRYPVG